MRTALILPIFSSVALAQVGVEPGEQTYTEPVPAQKITLDLHASWNSLYVSEGRDDLDGDSLFSTEFNASYGLDLATLAAGVWYAEGGGGDYTELNLYGGLAREIAGWEVALVYNRLEFLDDDEFDNEISLGIFGEVYGLNLGADFVYSTEAEGVFSELHLPKELELSDKLGLTPALLLGANGSYVDGESNGANNLQPSLEAA